MPSQSVGVKGYHWTCHRCQK